MDKARRRIVVQLAPYLNFNGNCREAMTFYQDCLGGDLSVMTFGEAPMSEQMPEEARNNVMHSQLAAGAITVMAADTMPGMAASQGGGPVTLALVSDDRDEIRGYYDKLSAGGTITQPLEEAFFGMYGALNDQFGISWMFQAGQGEVPS
jgi:PhnB protein